MGNRRAKRAYDERMKRLPETAYDLEAAYLQGLLPPKAKEAYERLAWALDVPLEDLPRTLARLGLPRAGWILTLGLVGWREGVVPPGAEVLAEEGLLDLQRRTLTRKGRVVHDALEAVVWAVATRGAEGRGGRFKAPRTPRG